MKGPFDYDTPTIQSKVDSEKIGNYALGKTDDKGDFYPKYVGRSDSDLQGELTSRLQDKDHHSKFKFSYADSKKEAFEKECKNYHDFEKSLENKIHPDSPNGMNLKCPVCGK